MTRWTEGEKPKRKKSKALEDADAQTKDLSNAMEVSVAELARLGVEIQNVETELEQNTHSLAEAGATRKKQAEDLHREEFGWYASSQSLSEDST